MARFEATTSDEAGRVLVRLAGECDLAVAEQLNDTLLAAVRRVPVVVVDVAGLDFLDSVGVHGLITAHHAARDRGGRLYVVNPTGAVATVLDLTGVAALLSPAADHSARAAADRPDRAAADRSTRGGRAAAP